MRMHGMPPGHNSDCESRDYRETNLDGRRRARHPVPPRTVIHMNPASAVINAAGVLPNRPTDTDSSECEGIAGIKPYEETVLDGIPGPTWKVCR